MVGPVWVVGGGLVLGLQLALPRWSADGSASTARSWPWKGVVWAAHVPAATATVTFLLYGTH